MHNKALLRLLDFFISSFQILDFFNALESHEALNKYYEWKIWFIVRNQIASYQKLEDLGSNLSLPGSFRRVFSCRRKIKPFINLWWRMALDLKLFTLFISNYYRVIDDIQHLRVGIVSALRVLWHADVNQVKCKDHRIGGFRDFCVETKVNFYLAKYCHSYLFYSFPFQKVLNLKSWDLLS